MNLGLIYVLSALDFMIGVRCHDAITSSGRLACSATKLCGEFDRAIWRKRRADVETLLEYKQLKEAREYALETELRSATNETDEEVDRKKTEKRDKEDAFRKILNLRSDFCFDHQTAGFLLTNESDGWPVACVWTASDVNGTCAPSKPTDRLFDFIGAVEWRKKIEDFRVAIGCSSDQIQLTKQIHELYICREHCTQAGIGYFFSLFVMISLVMVLGVFCF